MGRQKEKACELEAVHGLKLFQFEQKTEMEQELIYQELKNTCRTYIEVSTGDVALPPFFSEWDSCLRKVLPERSQSN